MTLSPIQFFGDIIFFFFNMTYCLIFLIFRSIPWQNMGQHGKKHTKSENYGHEILYKWFFKNCNITEITEEQN